MRRPPDRENISERDVESSNATLNALFGGARQKPWMSSSSGPVRPSPRSSVSKPAAQNGIPAQRMGQNVLPSPAPSDEASPTMSPGIVEPTRIDEHRHHTTREEPQQSIDLVTSARERTEVPSSALVHEDMARRGQRTSGSMSNDSLEPLQRQSPNHHAADPPFLAAVSIHNPPLTSHPEVHGIRRPDIPDLQDRANPPATMNASHNPARSHPNDESHHQVGPNQSLAYDELSSTYNVEHNSLPLPSAILESQARSVPSRPSPIQPNPNKRKRIQAPVMPSLAPRVALIVNHITSTGGPQNLSNALEKPRFGLLKDACSSEDAFYVALHQIFCLWSCDRKEVISIPSIPTSKILGIAFKILGLLIRDNDALAPAHLRWFAQFPSPLSQLLKHSEPYRLVVQDVSVFLAKLAENWASFSGECVFREYPPLVDELCDRMSLLSPVLQGVVFTATRRNLGMNDDVVGRQVEEIFKEDQRGHRELAARYNTARPPTVREIMERNGRLVEKYRALRRKMYPGGDLRPSSDTIPSPIDTSAAMSYISPLLQSPTLMSPASGQTPGQISGGNLRTSSHAALSPIDTSAPLTYMSPYLRSPSLISPGLGQTLGYQVAPAISPTVPGQPYAPNQPETAVSSNPSIQFNDRPPSVTGQRTYLVSSDLPTAFQTAHFQPREGQNRQFQQVSGINDSYALTNQLFPENSMPNHNAPPNQASLQAAVQRQRQHNQQDQERYGPSEPQYVPLQPQYLPPQQQNSRPPPRTNWLQQQVQQQLNTPSAQGPPQQVMQPLRQRSRGHQRQTIDVNRVISSGSNNNGGYALQSIPSRASSISSAGQRTPNGVPHNTSQSVPNHAAFAYAQSHPLQRPLIPPHHYTPPSQPVNPELTALHQARARSPILVPAEGLPHKNDDGSFSGRFYQALKNFALPPTRMAAPSVLYKLNFDVSEEEYKLVAQDTIIGTDRIPKREIRSATLQYRLRCVQKRLSTPSCLIREWSTSDTVWPDSIFIEVNNKPVEIRRKAHHGKDLPVDLTRLVLPSEALSTGTNTIRISAVKMLKEKRDISYFIAVEVIEILHHPTILAEVTQHQRIPEEQTLSNIKLSLRPSAIDEDEDIAMVSSDLSIDLADPFTARIFEIPVKGSTCLHRECFDLETFLSTRNGRARQPGGPCLVDVWKCPLCARDARPSELRVDEFLCRVREELERQGNLDVKAILVAADGSWKPKVEMLASKKRKQKTAGADSEDESEDEAGQAKRAKGRSITDVLTAATGISAGNRVIEIIDLDDG